MPDSRAAYSADDSSVTPLSDACRPAVGWRFARLLVYGLLGAWFVFAALVLVLRFVVLPGVAGYRADIEAAASRAVGQAVRIGHIEAGWKGLNPDLVLDDVVMLDAAGAPALSLGRVESVLSWHSLWQFKPILSLLALDRPILHVRRDRNGQIRIAGVEAQGDGDPAFADWLLAQRRIRIRNAEIVWEDALRDAPPLALSDLNFGMDNVGERHRFGLTAAPPPALAAHIDLRGEIRGNLNEALEQYAGRIYLELRYADLAGWQPWLDYPLDLPRGRGAMRVWGQLADGEVKATADVALEDVRVRLGKALPVLDLSSLRGRLEVMYGKSRWSVSGRRVEWLTQDGIRMAPNDFKLRWEAQADEIRGEASALLVDVGALGRLAAYLPLDTGSRKLLETYQPRGRLEGVQLNWTLTDEVLSRYALTASFNGLGVRAKDYFPGASGLSGKIDATEAGGRLSLDSQRVVLSLPAVFPEPDIALDTLAAGVTWRRRGEALEIAIERVAFDGNDATGRAHGHYRYTGHGPGEIDLQAEIDRADGTAVWRYMPHVVNATARQWIRRGIVAGTAHEGRLVLRGDLRDFPFRDPSTGKFEVTAKAKGAKIDYADGWPVIEDIEGEMHFDYGMAIRAQRGRILGAELSKVSVDIPDFDVNDEHLLVQGDAAGPTAEFLKFIDASPVAEAIDRFTDGMKAYGRGRLGLNLDIPLRRPEQTRVRGQ
ncbi:MAG: TIGR02099 family protein, partial [Azonexus sp.]|nr:TIGR02099 family protein [Azonexus sp.]